MSEPDQSSTERARDLWADFARLAIARGDAAKAARYAWHAATLALGWQWVICDICQLPTFEDRMRLVRQHGVTWLICWECLDREVTHD